MNNIILFLKKHIDFKIYSVSWIAIITALLILPAIKYLPQQFGYENGLLENLQMVFLFFCCYLGFSAKYNKKFFKFTALVVIILILREINCGRTIFFPIPGEVNAFYGWKDIKYGWLAHPLYGIYMASVGIYFLVNKLYKNLWDIVKNIKFPIWNIILLFVGIILGEYAEKCTHNFVFEEMGELLFYTSLTGILWLYTRNNNFINKE